jgi:hypothetical protein
MKRNLTMLCIVFSLAILFGSGLAWAGGRGHSYRHPDGYRHQEHSHKGPDGGYRNDWARHRHHHHHYRGPRYYSYRFYGPPARYYYHNYFYPGSWGPYGGGSWCAGGYSVPGFGFVFGTRGNW